MKARIIISALSSFFCIGAVCAFYDNPTQFQIFYAENMRGSLFSAFLTIGGFLFSLKTFIIIKMKENVYDHEKYKGIVEKQQRHNSNITRYGPLRRLSELLFISVFTSIVASLSNFSIGLIDRWWAAFICVWLSFLALILLIISLIEIKNNINQWFEFMEDEGLD